MHHAINILHWGREAEAHGLLLSSLLRPHFHFLAFSSSSYVGFCLCFPTALSHQPADHSWVQPLRGHHGQLPVQPENVSAGHRRPAGRGAAAGEQSATVLDPLRPQPPPCLHRLRRGLSPEGEFGALSTSKYASYFIPGVPVAVHIFRLLQCNSVCWLFFSASLQNCTQTDGADATLSNFSTLVSFKLLFLWLCVRCEPLLLPPCTV